MKTRRLIGGALIVLLADGLACGQEPTPRLQDKPTSELVRMLGSERFTERETAQRALTKRDDVLPELHRALKSKDAEIVRRAASICAG